MTPRHTVIREGEPAPHPTAELKKLLDGQLEATGDLRERVKALETDSKHYATKADLANVKVWAMRGIAGGLLSIIIALVAVFVRLSLGN